MREAGAERHLDLESDADPARDEVRVAAVECAYHRKRAYSRFGRCEPTRACRLGRARLASTRESRRARMHRLPAAHSCVAQAGAS